MKARGKPAMNPAITAVSLLLVFHTRIIPSAKSPRNTHPIGERNIIFKTSKKPAKSNNTARKPQYKPTLIDIHNTMSINGRNNPNRNKPKAKTNLVIPTPQVRLEKYFEF